MAINKKMLQRLLNNPANVSADDMDEEEMDMAPQVEMPEGEYQLPEELGEAVEDATDDEMEEPVIQPEVDDSARMRVQSSPEEYQANPEVMQMLQKLKGTSDEGLDELDGVEVQDVAGDMRAPMDLRKKALQKIKNKYLGQ